MTEPATREDLEKARDAIIKRLDDQNILTRAHIGSEVATMRGDVAHTKNYMRRVLAAMKRFLNRMGIGTDDL